MTQTKLTVHQLGLGPMENFTYLIAPEGLREEAAVIDPGWEVAKIRSEAERHGLTIKKIFLTHAHYDHARGARELARLTGAPVYVHASEAGEIPLAEGQVIETQDGTRIALGGMKAVFLHTPGHTAGSQCILIGENLFTGDTLFVGNCGRTDLPTSSPEKMFESMRLLSALPDETVVYPGHDYGRTRFSTIGRERKENPCLSRTGYGDFLGIE